MTWLRQSTAATVVMGPFVDDTDMKTPETALTISQADIRLSKNAGTYAQTNNAAGATHLEGGDYAVPLNTTDTNTLGRLRIRILEAGALVVWRDFEVVTAAHWDAVYSTGLLAANATQIDGVSSTNLRRAMSGMYVGTVTGGGTTTTLIDSGLTQAAAGWFNGAVLVVLTGTLALQRTRVTNFAPASDQLTFTALTGAVSNGDIYIIL